jgi:hypothetical protein
VEQLEERDVPSAVRALPGFFAGTLPANDDGSTVAVDLGFGHPINFGGLHSGLFVNNNGNVTFDSPLSAYTPFGLSSTDRQIIAPFFADVDTRGVGSGLVHYGNDIVNGHQAFGVEWPAVGYYNQRVDKLNTFELILIDRPDLGVGSFKIEFNYNQVQWETGNASGGTNGLGGSSAVVGFSNGVSGPANVSFQLQGSAINGALIDGGPNALISHQLNSAVPGRYDIFPLQPDIAASSLAFNASQGGVDFSYRVTGADLPQQTTVGLFWANGPNQDNIISQGFSQTADGTVGTHTVHVTPTQLVPAPQGATYLLNIVDLGHTIDEDPSNNVIPLRLPHIEVVSPLNTTVFRITAAPAMPSITVGLGNVPSSLVQSLSVTWNTRVTYRAVDYPAIPNVRGPGRDIASPLYTDTTIVNSTEFRPSFMVDTNQVIRGGTLVLTATLTIAGLDIEVSTPNQGENRLQILGDNPEKARVSNYVNGLRIPARWPGDTQYDYHTILRRIISQESTVQQFVDGIPYWSRDGARGVGMMQLTNPRPTDDQVWDWRRNIDRGANFLSGEKLATAIQRLNRLFDAVQLEARRVGAQAAPITGDMIVLETIRAFNGFDNGNGILDEFRPARDAQGRLVITYGRTSWERVPVGVRGTGGDPDYVNHVLGQADF